jgi:hypothetical protein
LATPTFHKNIYARSLDSLIRGKIARGNLIVTFWHAGSH